ncbi:thiamine pyrophosphate-binding protein [Streptosporangium sp. NPDC003464]
MNVAEAVGGALASFGVDTVFGVVGSGNFHVTNTLVEHGVRFVARGGTLRGRPPVQGGR